RRGEGMRRAADALLAKALLEDTRHEREEAAAADDVEPPALAPRGRASTTGGGEGRLDGPHRGLDERGARGVDLVGGQDERLLPDRREFHEDAPRVRREVLLLARALFEDEGTSRAVERANRGPVQNEREDRVVKIVAAEPAD